MKNILLLILFIFWVGVAFSQNCENNLETTLEWNGKTIGSIAQKEGESSSIVLTDKGNGKYEISDISAGLFKNNYIDYVIPAEIQIDCSGKVMASTFYSEYGNGKIISGEFFVHQRELNIQWEIEKNQLFITSIFNFSL